MKTVKLFGHLAIAVLLISGCRDREEEVVPVKPTIEIVSIDDVKFNRVSLTCRVVSQGSAQVNIKGVCYSDVPNPTAQDNKLMTNSLQDEFEIEIAGLRPNKTYYLRAYANSIAGIAYSEEVEVTTLAM